MAGSRYDSDFLFLSASWGHPSYLYHKGVCHPRHTDDSGRAQSHKPIFRPSRFLSSLMPHTLSLFICLHPSRKHTERAKGKKREKRYMHVRSEICRESAAPAKTQWQAGWRQRGSHPTPHSGVQCVWRARSLREARHSHITRSMHNHAAAESQSPAAGWIRHVLLSLWYTMQLTLGCEDGQKSSTCT